ncbi:TetR/AcrR family transcriptional regulator [Streptomyces sp. NPDC058459]|uniref:TetR/AcrR family transcriptional regulator n=1 Tax=Streptomyces sp. NPDC058459 TaxID=3346508 RepID=UPI003667CBAD
MRAADRSDRRVRRTRSALMNALKELIREKRYESITVADLLERADVGRSTFYTHFSSKDDLLAGGIEDIGAELRSAFAAAGHFTVEPVFRHAGDHRDLYLALSHGPAGRLFLDQLHDHLAQWFTDARDDDGTAAIRAHYAAGAVVGALRCWLADPRLTAEDAARLVEDARRSPAPGV